ncbi:MAG TPA: four helix bundle protein [Anaerolineales bacterium]|nr:four helix bundle protein [Anaerolineales bacterium]
MTKKTDRTEKGFRKLIVWQRAHQLVLQIYKFTEEFPKHEMFGLISQLRRAMVSVPANIAEGYAAGGKGQFGRYLDIAQGSLAEVEYYLILAQELSYITQTQYEQAETLRAETGFLLHRLIESLGRK